MNTNRNLNKLLIASGIGLSLIGMHLANAAPIKSSAYERSIERLERQISYYESKNTNSKYDSIIKRLETRVDQIKSKLDKVQTSSSLVSTTQDACKLQPFMPNAYFSNSPHSIANAVCTRDLGEKGIFYDPSQGQCRVYQGPSSCQGMVAMKSPFSSLQDCNNVCVTNSEAKFDVKLNSVARTHEVFVNDKLVMKAEVATGCVKKSLDVMSCWAINFNGCSEMRFDRLTGKSMPMTTELYMCNPTGSDIERKGALNLLNKFEIKSIL